MVAALESLRTAERCRPAWVRHLLLLPEPLKGVGSDGLQHVGTGRGFA